MRPDGEYTNAIVLDEVSGRQRGHPLGAAIREQDEHGLDAWFLDAD